MQPLFALGKLSRLAIIIAVLGGLLLAGGRTAMAGQNNQPANGTGDEQPVNVFAFPNAPGAATVTWTHSGDGVFYFVIEEQSTGLAATADIGKRIWTFSGLRPNTTYRFRVCAVYALNRVCSDENGAGYVSVTTLPAQPSASSPSPTKPVITGSVPTASSLRISWDAMGYPYSSYTVRVRQKAAPGAPDNAFRDIDVPDIDRANTLVGNLQPNTTYQFQVRGCDRDFFVILDCQDWGPIYEATTLPAGTASATTGGQSRPTPVISMYESGDTWIDVFWQTTPSYSYGKYVVQYQPQTAAGGAAGASVSEDEGGDQSSHTVYNLTPGTTYVFTVQGCDSTVTYTVNAPPVVGWDCATPSAQFTAKTNPPLLTGGGTLVPALLSVSAPTVTAGNTVTVTGQAFAATGTVTLTLTGSGSPVSLGTATINQGGFSTTVTIPATTSPGSYKAHAQATGAQADADLQVIAQGGQGTLTITDPGSGLTYTGVNFDYAFTLNGTNFTPGAVTIFLDSSTGPQVGTATVGGDGTFKQNLTIATGQTSTGKHTLVVVQNGTTQASLPMTIETLEDVH